ncbi:cell division FtsZ family protein [Akkermansiaceae bacterium]|nr:cell division FtsZ family protein [Akkermansiaceae bacterium]MDB4541466.1 cell division FtsZ family protein [Akkermansiaceae bacterium]
MIKFERNRQQTIPESAVKIIGLGGAGANMIDRVALDGIEGAELLALNTDVRTLASSVAGEKIQLGRNLTKGLGAGGDPELGMNSVLEAEDEVREALKARQIVFLCVGLGGGTGSGAAPIVTRIAREAGAFVVIFATMPFGFEGSRRRTQAEESLNQLAVLANALVTFDNGRMGELVLPKQGVHEAFSAADRMISDSITAVSRLVLRPGLVNIGLDELMTALKTTRSRCLFGSGLARGESRATGALKSALESPLLDRGSLLADATTVLVHICGGEDMTLFEIDLLMEGLMKHVPEEAHVLFGAATDSSMADAMSVTIISALPEDRLQMTPVIDAVISEPHSKLESESESDSEEEPVAEIEEVEDVEVVIKNIEAKIEELEIKNEALGEVIDEPKLQIIEDAAVEKEVIEVSEVMEATAGDNVSFEVISDEELDGEAGLEGELEEAEAELEVGEPDGEMEEEKVDDFASPQLRVVEHGEISDIEEPAVNEVVEDEFFEGTAELELSEEIETDREESIFEKIKRKPGQGELELEGGPKGRFDGETPNLENGEDLDIPPYLRRKKRR